MNLETQKSLSLIDGLHSTPARRYLSKEPIADEIIWDILNAAIRGPSGGNSQHWGWIVVKDQNIKDQIAHWYRAGWNRSYGVKRESVIQGTDVSNTFSLKNYLSAEYLANHLEEAPVWIFAVLCNNTATSGDPRSGSSIYGAVQNLMLAARAYGIGSTLTTLYSGHESEVKKLLSIPEDAMTMALIPLGYPNQGKWAQPKRQSVEKVTHWDSWGNQRPH